MQSLANFVVLLLPTLGVMSSSALLAQGLTAVDGIKVGHHTLAERPTGCTVILAEGGAVGGVDVRGAAPGTRETDLLDPVNTVGVVHAIVLTGGSAFGLDSASGVMRYLEEKGVGFPTGVANVPIVPAAVLYDLRYGDRPDVRPGPECGYAAARSASTGSVEEGSIGAGAGATLGKLGGMERAMKGGIGSSAVETADGIVVAALIAVNAVGDVVDPSTGEIVAGVRSASGSGFADARKMILAGTLDRIELGENTTIGVIATNATLSKAQARRVAQMAHDGLARSIYPAHTAGDGDTLFVLATGTSPSSDVSAVGALAAEVTARAVVRAARRAGDMLSSSSQP